MANDGVKYICIFQSNARDPYLRLGPINKGTVKETKKSAKKKEDDMMKKTKKGYRK